MSKGSPSIKVRFPKQKLEELRRYIAEVNIRRRGEPYTVSSFLISCYEERIDKLERGRLTRTRRANEKRNAAQIANHDLIETLRDLGHVCKPSEGDQP